MLYLPHTRHDPDARELLETSVQDNVEADGASLAAFESALGEMRRLRVCMAMADLRPWAGQAGPGQLVPGTGASRPQEELAWGVPDAWRLEPVREYVCADFDRAVETPSGLVVQRGTDFAIVDADDFETAIDPVAEGAGPDASRTTLTSVPGAYATRTGRPAERLAVEAWIEGLSIVVGGPGRYEATLYYHRRATVTNGDDLSLLPGYVQAGRLTKEGVPAPYTLDDDDVISFDGTGTLEYAATAEYVFDGPSVALGDAVEHLERLPTKNEIEAYAVSDLLFAAPAVDASGLVGADARVGPTTAALFAGAHVLAGGPAHLTLVDHPTGEVLTRLTDPSDSLRGPTWTNEGELAVVAYETDRAVVYRLVPTRNGQSGGFALGY